MLVAFAVTACTKNDDFIAVGFGSDAVIFTNDRTLAEDIQIVIRRDPSGDFVAESFELYFEKGMFGRYTAKARPLFSQPVSKSTYDAIVARLESDSLKDLSRRYPAAGVDGWTWRIRRISNSKKIDFAFWCPEWTTDESGGELRGLDVLLELGRQISLAAGVSHLDAFRQLELAPNQQE